MNRIAMKTSGNFYTGNKADETLINNILQGINDELQFLFVTGGGNGNRGDEMDPSIPREDRDIIGMLYTLKNAIELYRSAKSKGIDNIVLSCGLPNPKEYLDIMLNSALKEHKDNVLADIEMMKEVLSNGYIDFTPVSLKKALEENKHIVHGGGSGFVNFTTDTAVSLVAGNAGIDTIFKVLTDYDCAYDGDPRKSNNARPIKETSYEDAIMANIRSVDSNIVYQVMEARNQILRIAGINSSLLDIYLNQEEIGTTIKKDVLKRVYRK